jgi:hypothetical protein
LEVRVEIAEGCAKYSNRKQQADPSLFIIYLVSHCDSNTKNVIGKEQAASYQFKIKV